MGSVLTATHRYTFPNTCGPGRIKVEIVESVLPAVDGEIRHNLRYYVEEDLRLVDVAAVFDVE